MGDEEFKKHFETMWVNLPPVKSEQELVTAMQKAHADEIDVFGGTAYRFYFIEDYCEDKSVFFAVENHAYCDGMSWLGSLNAISENGMEATVDIHKSMTLPQ